MNSNLDREFNQYILEMAENSEPANDQEKLRQLFEEQQLDENVDLNDAVLLKELPDDSDMELVDMQKMREKAIAKGVGFTTDSDKELFTRWSEYTFFRGRQVTSSQ